MNPIQTHYNTLGVAHTAENFVIRAAYRALSQHYHPDLNAGDAESEARMAAINVAYAVLSDPKSRPAYDAFLKNVGPSAPSQNDAQSRANPVSARARVGSDISEERIIQFIKIFLLAGVVLVVLGALLGLRDAMSVRKEPVRVLAERGEIPSQLAMGWKSLVPEEGQKEDVDQAIKWFEKAAMQGNTEAQYQLGRIYTSSLSERHDDDKGKAWLLKAAEAGYAKAQKEIGMHYFYGNGIDAKTGLLSYASEKDIKIAIFWFEQAALQGGRDAQMSLGNAYDTGNPGTDDLVKAYAWLWLASDYSFWESNRRLAGVREHGMKKLDGRMSNKENAQAMDMAAQLKKQIKRMNSEN